MHNNDDANSIQYIFEQEPTKIYYPDVEHRLWREFIMSSKFLSGL